MPGADWLTCRPFKVVVRHEDLGFWEQRIVANMVPVAMGQDHARYVLAAESQLTQPFERVYAVRIGACVDQDHLAVPPEQRDSAPSESSTVFALSRKSLDQYIKAIHLLSSQDLRSFHSSTSLPIPGTITYSPE